MVDVGIGAARPPGVRLVAGDQALDGVEGSSTWRGIAHDRLLELPDTWPLLAAGEKLRFEEDGPPPDESFLTVYPAASVADRSMSAIAGIELEPERPSWRVELPPGRYLITLSRTWGGSESVVHAFAVEVRGPDHG